VLIAPTVLDLICSVTCGSRVRAHLSDDSQKLMPWQPVSRLGAVKRVRIRLALSRAPAAQDSPHPPAKAAIAEPRKATISRAMRTGGSSKPAMAEPGQSSAASLLSSITHAGKSGEMAAAGNCQPPRESLDHCLSFLSLLLDAFPRRPGGGGSFTHLSNQRNFSQLTCSMVSLAR
jgi:hypothetical protein